MFGLKKPCVDCPFIKGSSTNISLAEGRIEGIIDDLHSDLIFSCHKTINYENKSDRSKNQFCAGAMNYLLKEGRPNSPMQIAERLGFFKPSKLQGQENIIDIIDMLMPWQKHKENRVKTHG